MDHLDSRARSENMRSIRSRNTAPEIAVRSLLHRLGYRFRLHVKDLPGKPDIVLPKYGKVIFVHGCFWHQHPRCKQIRAPKTRVFYWVPKFEKNRQRDKLHCRSLRELGWEPIIVWECELAKPERLKRKLIQALAD